MRQKRPLEVVLLPGLLGIIAMYDHLRTKSQLGFWSLLACVHLFVDGTCSVPKDRHFAFAASAVACAQPTQHDFRTVRAELLPGTDQCILGAEILAAILALGVSKPCVIYSDCKTFMDKANFTPCKRILCTDFLGAL